MHAKNYFNLPRMMFSRFFQRLSEPFPSREPMSREVLGTLGVSLFVSVFLYLFRPGGMAGPDALFIWICLGFGLVTFAVSMGFTLFCEYVLKLDTDSPRWTLGKWLLQMLALISLIAVGNLLFLNALNEWRYLTLAVFFEVLINTWIIGVFPVVFFGLTTQVKALKHNLALANDIATQQGRTAPKSEQYLSNNSNHLLQINVSQNEVLQIARADLRYAEAMQNYLSLYTFSDARLSCTLLRSTVSSWEEELCDTRFVRCHRSYLVNLDAVTKVSGNAQGLKLFLQDVSNTYIPVSRSYIEPVRSALESPKHG